MTAADRPPLFAAPDIALERRPDGARIMRSRVALRPYARCVGDWLVRWATQRPVSIRAVAAVPVPPDPSFAGALDLVQIRTDALPVLEDALLATLAGERLPAGMRRRLLAGLAGRERTQGSEGPGGRVRAGAPAGAPEPGPRSAGR